MRFKNKIKLFKEDPYFFFDWLAACLMNAIIVFVLGIVLYSAVSAIFMKDAEAATDFAVLGYWESDKLTDTLVASAAEGIVKELNKAIPGNNIVLFMTYSLTAKDNGDCQYGMTMTGGIKQNEVYIVLPGVSPAQTIAGSGTKTECGKMFWDSFNELQVRMYQFYINEFKNSKPSPNKKEEKIL